MEWLKANKWIVIAGLVVLAVLFGGGGEFIGTDK
jgi:uncharacterized membrane protein